VTAKAIPIQKVLELSILIRQRLKKEANGPDQLDDLKVQNPRLAQLMVDIDWTLTHWGRRVVRGATKNT